MEQKMLLPIVLIVLVGGFVIGYYAATFGGGGKSSVSGLASSKLYLDVSSAAVTDSTLSQTFEGVVTGADESGWTLSTGSSSVMLPKGRTVFYQRGLPQSAGGPQPPAGPLDPSQVKVGNRFSVNVKYDVKKGTVISVFATKI